MESSGKQFLHKQLRESILKLIRRCPVGEKLPTERELTIRFHASRGTVNKVMVELERDGYVTRRGGKGTFVSPRDAETHLENDRNRNQPEILLAYPEFFSYNIWENVHLAEISALRRDIRLRPIKLMAGSNYRRIFDLVSEKNDIVGCIILPPREMTMRELAEFDQLGIPCVFFQWFPKEFLVYSNIYGVHGNSFLTGYNEMKFLLRNGHRRIALVCNEPQRRSSDQAFFNGIYHAASEAGIPRGELILADYVKMRPWDQGTSVGYQNTVELCRQHRGEFTAILFESLYGAIGGRRAIDEAGLRCPEEISIITCQEHWNFCDYFSPPLTTSTPDHSLCVERAFDLILNPAFRTTRMSILDDTSITVRQSVRNLSGSLSQTTKERGRR